MAVGQGIRDSPSDVRKYFFLSSGHLLLELHPSRASVLRPQISCSLHVEQSSDPTYHSSFFLSFSLLLAPGYPNLTHPSHSLLLDTETHKYPAVLETPSPGVEGFDRRGHVLEGYHIAQMPSPLGCCYRLINRCIIQPTPWAEQGRAGQDRFSGDYAQEWTLRSCTPVLEAFCLLKAEQMRRAVDRDHARKSQARGPGSGDQQALLGLEAQWSVYVLAFFP